MKTRLIPTLCVLLLAWLVGLTIPTAAQGLPEDEVASTEDVIHMLDGRELHGQILEEKNDVIIFEFLDQNIKIKHTMTLLIEEIAHIERDISLGGASEISERVRIKIDEDEEDTGTVTYGARKLDLENLPEGTTTFYILPMKGQVGTDVCSQIYREIADDIRAHKPDYLIIEMDCSDRNERLFGLIEQLHEDDRGKYGIGILDMFRDIVNLFHDDLRDTEQVLWIRDSVGASSLIAFSWDNIFLHSEGTLGGTDDVQKTYRQGAFEREAKFREAYVASIKGLAEYGDTQFELLDAMIRPEMPLSGTWKGRKMEWRLDLSGQYVVDGSPYRPASFSAKHAEDFCVSDGTADTLDDLALLMGVREYVVLDGQGEEMFEEYRENWRRKWDQFQQSMADAEKYLGWASGEDTVMYLGRAKSALERALACIERYDAVALRALEQKEGGVNKTLLKQQIELLKKQIAMIRRNNRGGGAGGGRGGSGSGTGSPGPG